MSFCLFSERKGFSLRKSAPQRCTLAQSEDVASDCARREGPQSGLFIGCVKGKDRYHVIHSIISKIQTGYV